VVKYVEEWAPGFGQRWGVILYGTPAMYQSDAIQVIFTLPPRGCVICNSLKLPLTRKGRKIVKVIFPFVYLFYELP